MEKVLEIVMLSLPLQSSPLATIQGIVTSISPSVSVLRPWRWKGYLYFTDMGLSYIFCSAAHFYLIVFLKNCSYTLL